MLCLSHRSNLDVPTLYALLEDQADLSVFHRIIWIAGRKLSEDSLVVEALVDAFQSHPDNASIVVRGRSTRNKRYKMLTA